MCFCFSPSYITWTIGENCFVLLFLPLKEREGDLGFGGGRDRFRRDYHHHHDQHRSRFEEKSSNFQSRSGRFGGRTSGISNKTSNAPPSRHLWVGNLSHSLMESDLTSHFLRFGELESVAFQPGRSYAFLNFAREEDAIDAIEALQGFPLAGNPLRIEFAKAVSLIFACCYFSLVSISMSLFVVLIYLYVCLFIKSSSFCVNQMPPLIINRSGKRTRCHHSYVVTLTKQDFH